MALSRGFLGLLFLAWSVCPGFSEIPRSSNDLWDVSSGTQILNHTPLRAGFIAEAMFGAQDPFPEPNQTVFADGQPAGFVHSVDWKTPSPVRVTRIHLFAAGDGPIYLNEREIEQVVIKARLNATDPYFTVHTFTPSHPYTFLDTNSQAILAIDIPPVEAQFFRAEFVQWESGRGFDGPRIVEIDAFGSQPPPSIPQSRDDLWDVSKGIVITGTSGFRGGFADTDMFGTTLSIEHGQSVFNDGAPNGFTHYVEWRTPNPIRLNAFNLFAAGDGPVYLNEREFAEFRLQAKRGVNDQFTTIYTYTPTHPYTFLDPSSTAIISTSIPEIVAQYFRAEFVQWNAGRGYDGPRVIELDGFGQTLVPPTGPVADWTIEDGLPGFVANNVRDFTGNGHDGVVYGSAFFEPSELSSNGAVALRLAGGSHFAPAPSHAFIFPGDFTLEAILEPTSGNTDANRGVIVAQNPENGGLAYVLDYRSESRTANFALVAADGSNEFVTVTLPHDGVPHHVAGVRKGDQLRIYLDRQLVETKATTITPNLPFNGPIALRVGASSAGYWFEGTLDRVRISQGALEVLDFIEYQPPALRFTLQPQSQTATVGTNITFSASVNYQGPLNYQWFFNDVPLPGANSNVLVLRDIQLTNAGSYFAQVTANGQTVRSDNATLAVTSPAGDGPSHDDLFDVLNGNRVTSHSGVFPFTNVEGMFGNETSSIEQGSTIFSDQQTNGFTHFVEWRTAAPVLLRAIRLFASGDGAVYLHEREFQSFTLKTKSSPAAQTFDQTLLSYDASHPYTFLDPESLLLLEAQFNDVLAQEFRAEFVQWNAGRGYDGPRVIELDGIGEFVYEVRKTVSDWTFEEGIPGNLVDRVRDTSGSSNHITQIVGNAARFAGTINGPGLVSVDFPPGSGGFGSGLRSSDSLDFNLGNSFTIETSINPGFDNAEHNRGILVGQNARTGRLAYAFDYRSEERRVHFVIMGDSGLGDFVEARIPDDGKSHHVAGVFNNGIMSIYLDKVLTESKPTIFRPAVLPNDPVRVTLGANDIGGYWFHGVIDRARISRQALPPSEFFPHESDSSPLVILQPLHDVTVEQGGTATFHVVAAGAAAFNYRWSFNDQILSNEVSDTLVLNNVRPSDAGTYRVTASSGPWEISSSANLTVTGAGTNAPVIQMHPQSRIAGLGTSVQFTVTALSSSPLTYQWFFNGGAIPAGTNAVLWLTTLGETNAGTYHVNVSNSGGSTISRPAVLNLFSSSLSGGELYLDNHTFGVDAPVTDDRGIRLSGHDFLAQLYGSPANQPAFPVGAAVPFGTDENAGYFSDIVSRVIPGTTSGVPAVVEIRAWDARTGRTYEEAAQNGGLHGASLLSVVLGGGNLPPAYLVGMQPFSLVARPRITHQPADLSVTSGRTAVFQVGVSGTPPFTYQWRFNGARMDGETRPSLVISNVSSLHEGDYSVAVINPAGAVTSEAATLTVLPRDTEPPVITLTSPLPGVTTNPRITLAGTATDNVGVTRVEGTRNGQPVGPISLTNGQFTATNIALIVGTNHFAVSAYDLEGNRATTNVSVVLEATRSLWIGLPSPNPIYEGGRIEAPIMVSSSGDIGALSFELTYDTNYLADPELEWRQSLVGVLEQVNTSTPGVVRATYILPGKSIRAGTNMLAVVGFRARSIPQMLETTVGFNLTGIFSATGDAITSGTSVSPRTIELLQRRIKGDNNANHRLDIADATILVRMLTLLDPIRIWDVPANDLNENNSFDAGDIVRVLRAVVRLDRQPTPAPLQQLSIPAAETAATIQLTADSTLLVPGQQVKVRVLLDGLLDPLSGASFELSYPTNALRLANETSHSAGAVVPQDALTMWNLTPDQDYPTQSGVIHFAAATPIEWSTNSGPIAEFNFTVQPGAADQWTWTLRLSNGEIGVDRDVIALSPSELTLTAREDLRAELSGGAYNSASGQFELRLSGKPGARYKVEFSEDLRIWTEISVVSDATGNVVLTDTPSTPGTRRFYRALELE